MLTGIAASGGFATGKILCLKHQKPVYSPLLFRGEKEETRRLERATAQFCYNMEQSVASLRRIVGVEEAEIFHGHSLIAHDAEFQAEMRQRIYWGLNAETAAETTADMYIARFLEADSAMTRGRAADIKDVKNALLRLLCEQAQEMPIVPFGSVIVARELTPSAVRFLERRRTVAIVTEKGDRNTHLAILARAMGIPAVMSVKGLMQIVHSGQQVIVDGNKGEVILI